jgi:hypothetical protein
LFCGARPSGVSLDTTVPYVGASLGYAFAL